MGLQTQVPSPKAQQARADARAAAARAHGAALEMGLTTCDERNAALSAMACALRAHAAEIEQANVRDVERARAGAVKESLVDRLALSAERIESMAVALENLCDLPDPIGRELERRTLYNGLDLTRVSVPLGVVAVVYEARPNVTADAAGICLKAGNAVVLRGGSMAAESNAVIARVLADAATSEGLPKGCIEAVSSTDRAATDELMVARGLVDVLIPRGGAGLIQHCVEHATVPVIETGTGNCHVYVDRSADLDAAQNVVVNAKCRRYGVCNACETLLVDEPIAEAFLPRVLAALVAHGVTIHADSRTRAIADAAGIACEPATEHDWATEYLAPEIAVRTVDGVDAAIDHINRYGTKHSESIMAADEGACERFAKRVDAAVVYTNASTAFTDGGQFGMGAEIGISTQKLHVRGPFALDGLTSYKYIVRGTGQVRA